MGAVTCGGAVVERTSHLKYLGIHFDKISADLRKTCGNNSTEVQKRSVSPEGYSYVTPSIAWRREAWKEETLDDLPLKGRERAIVNQANIGTVSKATLRKLLRHGVERIWAFPSA